MNQSYILEELRRRLGDYVMPSFLNVRLERAQLGNRAGMLGAAIAAGELCAQVGEDLGRQRQGQKSHSNNKTEAL